MPTRVATLDDVDAIVPMMRDFNAIESIAWDERIERGLRVLLATPSFGTLLLGHHDGGAIFGYTIATFGFDLEYGGPDALITEVYVRGEERGRGLGRELVEAAVAFARGRGAGAVHLMVRPENQPARALYARSGFREVPRLVMTRKL